MARMRPSGRVARRRDQINLPRGGASDQQILVRQRELAHAVGDVEVEIDVGEKRIAILRGKARAQLHIVALAVLASLSENAWAGPCQDDIAKIDKALESQDIDADKRAQTRTGVPGEAASGCTRTTSRG